MPETLGDKALRILKEYDKADGTADGRIHMENEKTLNMVVQQTQDAIQRTRSAGGTEEVILRGLINNYLDDEFDDKAAVLASDASIKAAFANIKLDLRATGGNEEDESPQQVTVNAALKKCVSPAR